MIISMLGIILYRPEKPSNVGNIMRTAMAIEAKLYIIGPLTFSLTNKDLKRAGMDYINESDFVVYENYEDVTKDIYFMFGRESTGIPHEVLRDNLDKTVRLPMVPSARSLNLSNCVAIVLFEALRQQNFYGLATHEVIKGEDFLIEELTKSE